MRKGTFEQRMDKGYIGERIVRDYLRELGYIIYKVDGEYGHPFDLLAVDMKRGTMTIVEVKTVPRRNRYADTGLALHVYEKYRGWEKKLGMDVFLIYVDEMLELVYGGKLDTITKKFYDKESKKVYPMIFNDYRGFESKIYFPLKLFKVLGKVEKEDAEKLRELSQRGHGYGHVAE